MTLPLVEHIEKKTFLNLRITPAKTLLSHAVESQQKLSLYTLQKN